MRLSEQWKHPVSRADTWKAILFTVLLLVSILAFGQIVEHSRFERVGWAVLLLLIWASAATQVTKIGRRSWQPFQILWLIAYTFFAVGNMVPQGTTAASWLTSIGAALLVAAGVIMVFDFRKSHSSPSSETLPPANS
jgi:uncharacterized membrane protein